MSWKWHTECYKEKRFDTSMNKTDCDARHTSYLFYLDVDERRSGNLNHIKQNAWENASSIYRSIRINCSPWHIMCCSRQ